MKPQKIKQKVTIYKQDLMEKGVSYVLSSRFNKLYNLLGFYIKILRTGNEFVFNRKTYSYLNNAYNFTRDNERSVEVPLIWSFVEDSVSEKVLELGNVLSHYYLINHDVLDKYEKDDRVINKDVVSFTSRIKYDLIVSISTLEHVGWDEDIKDPLKIPKAIKQMKKLLSKNGRFIFTVPFGYNSHLDELLHKNMLDVSKKYFMKRVSRSNIWKQVSWKEVKFTKYNVPYPNANAICIGVVTK